MQDKINKIYIPIIQDILRGEINSSTEEFISITKDKNNCPFLNILSKKSHGSLIPELVNLSNKQVES